MKLFSVLLLITIFGKGCDAQQKQDLASAIIEYTANTRGFYQKIVVQNQTIAISSDRSGKDKPTPIKLSDAEWKGMIADFQNIDLENVANMKAPSEKRFHDGAAIADVKITYKGKMYESQPFDHGNPPKEIAKLLNKITAFAKID